MRHPTPLLAVILAMGGLAFLCWRAATGSTTPPGAAGARTDGWAADSQCEEGEAEPRDSAPHGASAADGRELAERVAAVESASRTRTIEHLSQAQRQSLLATKVGARTRLQEKLRDFDDPTADTERLTRYLSLQRQLHVVEAQISLVNRGDVLLTDFGPPKPDGFSQIQLFTFVNNRVTLVDGTVMRNARLVFRIDEAKHPALRSLAEEIAALKKQSVRDQCYQFNSLGDDERERRRDSHARLEAEFMAVQRQIRDLDRGLPAYDESLRALLAKSREIWRARTQAVPAGIAVDPRTLLAGPSNR